MHRTLEPISRQHGWGKHSPFVLHPSSRNAETHTKTKNRIPDGVDRTWLIIICEWKLAWVCYLYPLLDLAPKAMEKIQFRLQYFPRRSSEDVIYWRVNVRDPWVAMQSTAGVPEKGTTSRMPATQTIPKVIGLGSRPGEALPQTSSIWSLAFFDLLMILLGMSSWPLATLRSPHKRSVGRQSEKKRFILFKRFRPKLSLESALNLPALIRTSPRTASQSQNVKGPGKNTCSSSFHSQMRSRCCQATGLDYRAAWSKENAWIFLDF